ncbi:cystatin-like fold lipoprotein [Macrococcoides canis]|uniref:cystatin-like fold lipoprotein n=1 Tax=Macrococcoides canis TaxID=1855823 RepID=UPI0022B90C60|nr:cystatin-like fold lipoprotein [Macrococcus canis]WBF53991.1 cystatin-like fold lipoprotein [Macrococcus canis]
MKKLGILLMMSLILVLTACGNKYEKDINQVLTTIENDTRGKGDSKWIELDKEKTNNYVYEDGNVIIIEYVADKDGLILKEKYVKNKTTGKFEYESADEESYMNKNEPIYKEMNLKKK